MNDVVDFPQVLCGVCGKREATILCDYPERGVFWACRIEPEKSICRESKITCDKELCQDCAIHVADDMDFCPEHAREIRDAIARQLKRRSYP